MSKRNRKPTKKVDEAKDFRGGGPEREGVTRRPYDPKYRNCTFDQATFDEQLARLYNEETIAHLAITRRSASNGDGHLPQPVRVETTSSQQAVRDLFQGAERVFTPLSPEPEVIILPMPEPISTSPRIEAIDDPNSPDFIPPFRRGGWKIVEL